MVPVAANGGMARRVGLKIEGDFAVGAYSIGARFHRKIRERIADVSRKPPCKIGNGYVVRAAGIHRHREASGASDGDA